MCVDNVTIMYQLQDDYVILMYQLQDDYVMIKYQLQVDYVLSPSTQYPSTPGEQGIKSGPLEEGPQMLKMSKKLF